MENQALEMRFDAMRSEDSFGNPPGVRAWWPGFARTDGLVAIAFLLGYAALDWGSYIYTWQKLAITPWNPPAALAVTLLVIRGPAWAPLVFLAMLASDVFIHIPDLPWWVSIASCAAAAGIYAATCWFLVRVVKFDPHFQTWRDLVCFVVVVPVAAGIVAAVFVALYCLGDLISWHSFFDAAARYWIGDVTGILVSAPLLCLLISPAGRLALRRVWLTPQGLIQLVVLSVVLSTIFGSRGVIEFKWFYLLFLPLVWISMRGGFAGAVLAVQWVQIGLVATIRNLGHASATAEEVQLLMLTLAATGLFLGLSVDERKQAVEDLRRSLRLAAAGEMAATVAHELNQPLTAIGNYSRASELMAKAGSDAAAVGPVVSKIAAEAARAGKLLARLRDFLRSGVTVLEPTPVVGLVDTAVAAVRDRAQELGVALTVTPAAAPPAVDVDRIEIGIVLRNLLDNALDSLATGPVTGRALTVAVDAVDAQFVKIAVSDNGPGVSRDMSDRLFDPFMTSKPRGMGLGLAICRAIVEAHGGRLWHETHPTTMFCLTLPIIDKGTDS
jgi:signal transduction histidine kinase